MFVENGDLSHIQCLLDDLQFVALNGYFKLLRGFAVGG